MNFPARATACSPSITESLKNKDSSKSQTAEAPVPTKVSPAATTLEVGEERWDAAKEERNQLRLRKQASKARRKEKSKHADDKAFSQRGFHSRGKKTKREKFELAQETRIKSGTNNPRTRARRNRRLDALTADQETQLIRAGVETNPGPKVRMKKPGKTFQAWKAALKPCDFVRQQDPVTQETVEMFGGITGIPEQCALTTQWKEAIRMEKLAQVRARLSPEHAAARRAAAASPQSEPEMHHPDRSGSCTIEMHDDAPNTAGAPVMGGETSTTFSAPRAPKRLGVARRCEPVRPNPTVGVPCQVPTGTTAPQQLVLMVQQPAMPGRPEAAPAAAPRREVPPALLAGDILTGGQCLELGLALQPDAVFISQMSRDVDLTAADSRICQNRNVQRLASPYTVVQLRYGVEGFLPSWWKLVMSLLVCSTLLSVLYGHARGNLALCLVPLLSSVLFYCTRSRFYHFGGDLWLHYMPHLVTCLIHEYSGGTNDATVASTIGAKARRFACLPISDFENTRVVAGSITVAKYLIAVYGSQQGFTTFGDDYAGWRDCPRNYAR